MILGVLSDTHGRADACRRAVDVLHAAGASLFVHCGDVGEYSSRGDPKPVFDALAGTACRFVWGNNDDPSAAAYASDLGLMPLGDVGWFTLAGVRIRVEHGDHTARIRRLLTGDDPGCDLLLTGHTHVAADAWHNGVRWVNPGALHRAPRLTAATIDLARWRDTDAVAFHAVTR